MTDEKKTTESLKLSYGLASLQAGGPMTVIVILFLCLAAINAGMVLYHHWGIGALHQAMIDGQTEVVNSLGKLTEAQEETTYIQTLTEAERQKLCLNMPASLRAKVKENGGRHSVKSC